MTRDESPWKPLRWPALLLALAFVYGVAGFMIVENWSFVDALFMTVLTLSTVAYGEVHPLSSGGELFAISLILLGIIAGVLAVSLALRIVAEGGLGERTRRRRMQRRIDAMEDHFVICAYGRVGRTVARELEAEAAPFVVIDRDESLEDEMLRDGIAYLIGDPTSEVKLGAAGIERAKALVCAVDDDADNVYITLAARSLNPDIFIVARASEAISADRLYRAGADRVISPYVSSGRHMALMALRPQVVDYLDVGEREPTNLRLEELKVDGGVGSRGAVAHRRQREGLPLALRRSSGEIITNPPPTLRLEGGDLLVLLDQKPDS
jgi:voltage-gated potassium channel